MFDSCKPPVNELLRKCAVEIEVSLSVSNFDMLNVNMETFILQCYERQM